MNSWEAVQKTLGYIDAHIGTAITIEALAQIAALSPFYYQRLFTKLVKKPVREYIKLRQLALSCTMLRNRDIRILAVALQHGFNSHETFTRAFKSAYGITPAQYRERPVFLDHFDKPDLLLHHVMVDEGVPLISDGLVLEMNRRVLSAPIHFAGKKGCFPFAFGKMLGERPGVSPSDEIQRAFLAMLPDIPHIPGGLHIGVSYPGDAPEGYTSYFAGVEVAQPPENPAHDSWVLPAQDYIVCGFEAESYEQLAPFALGKAMKFTRLWLKEHGLIAERFFPEIYYPDSPETAYMELWIPFRKRDHEEVPP